MADELDAPGWHRFSRSRPTTRTSSVSTCLPTFWMCFAGTAAVPAQGIPGSISDSDDSCALWSRWTSSSESGTNLDHTVVLPGLLVLNDFMHPGEVGTPMFKALELTCPSDLTRTSGSYNCSFVTFEPLVDAFEMIEETVDRDIILRAFPGDELNFTDTYRTIVADETARRRAVLRGKASAFVTLDSRHAPRHDAESVYWGLIWALGRALPRGAHDRFTGQFDNFFLSMVGEGSTHFNGNRQAYISPMAVGSLLHPGCMSLAPLLQHMAAHFSIPWDLYRDQVGRYHTHTALRRFLLLALLQGDKDTLAIPLDTEQSRRCSEIVHENVKNRSLATAGDAFSGMAPVLRQHTAPPRLSTKRPLDDDGYEGPDSSSLVSGLKGTNGKRRNTDGPDKVITMSNDKEPPGSATEATNTAF